MPKKPTTLLLSRLGVIRDQPRLRAAQLAAIGAKIPLLYLIMAVDALAFASHAGGNAPAVMRVWFPAAFIVACLARGAFWLAESRRVPSSESAVAERFRFSTALGGLVLALFVGWAVALFDYAAPEQRAALAFDALGLALTCTLCLMHYPLAAVLVLGTVVVPFVVVMLADGDPALRSMALSACFVSAVVLFILLGDFENFRALVDSREGLRDRHAEIERLHRHAVEAEDRRVRERRDMLGDLGGAFRQSIEQVTVALGGVARRSSDQAGEVAQNSAAALLLLDNTTVSAQAVDESSRHVAAAAADLCGSIAAVRTRMEAAVDIAAVLEQRTAEADMAMARLGATVGRIDAIASLIKAITEQIDLIALNATIEAARAGATGRAFGVVASEIKLLAKRTAQATGEIGQHTRAVDTASREACGSVEATKQAFLQLLSINGDMAAALGEQSKLTSEIGTSVDRSLRKAEAMRASLDQLSKSAAMTNRSADSLLGQCGVLGRESEALTREVGKFVGVLQAA